MNGWAQLFSGVRLWDGINLLLVLAILFVVVDTITCLQAEPHSRHMVLTDERMRLYISSTLTVGMLVWPILWNIAAATGGGGGRLGGGDRLSLAPRLAFGFFWPLLMLLVDLQHTRRRRKDPTFFESLQRIGYLKSDANTIITTAFAIGTLLVSMKRHGKAQGANLVMYALLLCVAFVMPTSDVPATSRLSILIRSSQKVCLNWAIGFVLAGISVDLVN